MDIDIQEMSLVQSLNAIQRMQSWLDEALQDRVEFTQEWGMRNDATENGVLMAHFWREQAIEHVLKCLRESVCERFDPPTPDLTGAEASG